MSGPVNLLEWLKQDDFVLSLSSGYFGFFAHCGFVKALHEEGLQPKLVTGSSAGAIVAACLAGGMSPAEMEKVFLSLGKDHFWDPGLGFGLLRGKRFEDNLQKYIPDNFEVLKVPLHVATYNIPKRKTEIFTSGNLPKVVRASCSMPLFFHPVKIGRAYYWDGGIQDKMGLSAVAPSERVFGHALRSGKFADWFERKVFASNNPQRKILSFDGIPATGPGKFHNGPQAIAHAYDQTKKSLYAPLS